MAQKTIDIVFDGPPDHESGRFVEVERDGVSVSIGEWVKRSDGYWVLRMSDPEAIYSGVVAEAQRMREDGESDLRQLLSRIEQFKP